MRPPSMTAGIVMMAIALVWILLTPSTVTTSQPAPRALKRIAPVENIDPQDGEGTVDLYGNEVSDAVAKYRTDVTGSLYELHSPHTELPRLGSPKS